MKKISVILLAMMTAVMVAGCVSMPLKQYVEVLPKTNLVCLGEVKMFKGVRGMVSYDSFKEPVDNDPYYQEVRQEYLIVIKENLEKRGFVVLEEPDPQTLILETKLGDIPPLLGGWTGIAGMGLVTARVEIKQNDRLLLYFEEAVSTGLGYQAKGQIKRHIAPRIARKLKEKFL